MRQKKRNFNDRTSLEEKIARVEKYMANLYEKGGGRVTLRQICDACSIPNNGHSGNAIMLVCERYSKWTIKHFIEIGIGGRVRYEIEVLK
jgi:hypothetical protein